jgi:hypothetical protein
MVPCQGWLGEAGALWALAIAAASNTVSIVTELMRDNFIPDAPYPEWIPIDVYRRRRSCTPGRKFILSNRMIAFRSHRGLRQVPKGIRAVQIRCEVEFFGLILWDKLRLRTQDFIP